MVDMVTFVTIPGANVLGICRFLLRSETCDLTKVRATTFQPPKEIFVVSGIDLDNS